MPSVLIVDNHLLIRYGLRHMLSQEHRGLVFGEAKNCKEADILLAKRHWDLVSLALTLPGKSGFNVLQEIRRLHPSTRVLILTTHDNPHYARRARHMGASGYVCKNAGRRDLLRAFKSVLAGKVHFEDLLPLQPVEATVPRNAALSAREREVMLAFAAGKRACEIAGEINLSVKTVSTYKRRILDKLRLHSTADLVCYVIDRHLSSTTSEPELP
jgi:DNA-binding NarL/FixJ family response regulator